MRLYLLMWKEPDAAIAAADGVLAEPGLAAGGAPPHRAASVPAPCSTRAAGVKRRRSPRPCDRPSPLPGTHEHAALDLCGLIEFETGEDLGDAKTG